MGNEENHTFFVFSLKRSGSWVRILPAFQESLTFVNGKALFSGASIAQMGAGLDHEIRLDLEIGPITIYIHIYIYFIMEYKTLETNIENELIT